MNKYIVLLVCIDNKICYKIIYIVIKNIILTQGFKPLATRLNMYLDKETRSAIRRGQIVPLKQYTYKPCVHRLITFKVQTYIVW